MPFVFKILRTACVWALIPMTVASGSPQMHCRSGETKGQRLGDCCLAKVKKQSGRSAACCCAHAASAKKNAPIKSGANLTCPQVQPPRTDGCCYWQDGAPRVQSKPVRVPELTALPLNANWTTPALVLPSIAQMARGGLADDLLPPPDRVILFQRFLI